MKYSLSTLFSHRNVICKYCSKLLKFLKKRSLYSVAPCFTNSCGLYLFFSQLKVSNTGNPKLKWVMTTHYTNSDSPTVVPNVQEKGAHEGRKKVISSISH